MQAQLKEQMLTTLKQRIPNMPDETIRSLVDIIPDHVYSSLDGATEYSSLIRYDEFKTKFMLLLEAEDSFIEQKVLFETEIIVAEQIRQNIQLIAAFVNQLNLTDQERELSEDEKRVKEFYAYINLPEDYMEIIKYQSYINSAYEEYIAGYNYLSNEQLEEYVNEQIIEHITENRLISPNDDITISTGKQETGLDFIIAKFIECEVSNNEQATVIHDLLTFLNTKFKYPQTKIDPLLQSLKTKVDFCNPKSQIKSVHSIELKEAAKMLKVCESTFRQWIKKYPDLPFSKIGRKYVFDKEKLLSWFYHQKQSAY